MSLSHFSHFFIYDNFVDDVTEDQAKHFKRIRSKIERVKTADPGIIFETQDVKKCVKAKMIVDDLKKLKHFTKSSSSRWLVWQTPVLLDEYFKYKRNIKRKADVKKEILNLLLLHDAIKTALRECYDETYMIACEIQAVSLCRSLDWITTIEYNMFTETEGVACLETPEDKTSKRKSYLGQKFDDLRQLITK